jgi:diguanylate cyclase (GGDEF)-like protein/putative nucleotidyltransferase with HDIG domain
MSAADLSSQARPVAGLAQLQAENALLLERLASAERYTAQTLARATRLSQVISVLGHDTDFDTVVERSTVEVAELFAVDVALLLLGPDDDLRVKGQWGVRRSDVPEEPFAIAGLEGLTAAAPVTIGPADELPLPEWLGRYRARHVAWARLLVGDEPLGLMLLVRRGPEPFERTDEKELQAIAYRIALAMENGLLHGRMSEQLVRLSRIHEFTTQLAGTLELEPVGRRVADVLVTEVPVAASVVFVDREGELVPIARSGCDHGTEPLTTHGWATFPLETTGKPVGCVAVANAPAAGTEAHELLLHLLDLAAMAVDKALLYAHSREQARRDSLTGLLGHRVFHEVLAEHTGADAPFSIVLIDIDDFKQINDLYGHQIGDDALRFVADALRRGVRSQDNVFRVGGEEFCVVLRGIDHAEAFRLAERLRRSVTAIESPLPVTVSLGVASYPAHGLTRDELLAQADAGLYASKRAGKNRTTVAGEQGAPLTETADRHADLALLHDRDPSTVIHSLQVATIAVDIARALGVEDHRLGALRTAAKLHDIGKIGVPDAILNKPAPLDEDEFRIVQTHPVVGAELLRAWGLDGPAAFVLQHHERIDGSGYPHGLRDGEIALEARIIHVADAFVAMTLDRPYRLAMDREEAMAELVRHRGTQFDAAAVDALLAIEHEHVLPAAA